VRKIRLEKNNRRAAGANGGVYFLGMKTLTLIFLAMLAALLWIASPSAHGRDFTALPAVGGETITVTTLNDFSDFSGSQQVGDLPGPDGRVSFREAVTAANNTAGSQTIAFAISPAEFWLVPDMALLRLEQGPFFINDSGTTVDFSTQTVNMGDTNPNGPEVGIYGLEPNGWGIAAIFVNGDNCIIKGLGKVYQRGYAVRIVGNSNRVIGCQIDGPLNAAVSVEGYLGSPPPSGNIVGGTLPGDGNYLVGLVINGPADGNIVIGNTVIGGVEVQGATQYGVIARNNRIGGTTPAERNVISGAGAYGEEGFPDGAQVSVIDADGTIVEGNYIGTTADGMARYPQQVGPIGVEVRDSRNTTIRSNLIAGLRTVGTDHYVGQVFGQAIYVGATNANSQDTLIEDNTIGIAADGVTPIVTRSGVTVSPLTGSYHALRTRISSNHIASVETTGVVVGNPENGVTITGNSIHNSGSLGIDLFSGNFGGTGGLTPNDPGDVDIGGNGLQNFPVLLSATTTGSAVMVRGTLDSSSSGQFVVEFFASPLCNPSGFGEGATFLGSTPVTTDGAGHAAFSITLPAAVTVGAKVTVTATRLSTGDTSEFSACVAVTSGATPTPTPVATPITTATPIATPTPTPVPTATPTPPLMVSTSGNVIFCSNPSLPPVPGVTMTLTGTLSGSTLTNGSGKYAFSSLPFGGNYTVTPTKAALTPGSAGINTLDVIAIQRHFLLLGTPLAGCQLTAADVNGVGGINTLDVIAVQRFFLGQVSGTANTGHYQFSPVNRSYVGLTTNRTTQNFDALMFGDVAGSTFVYRPEEQEGVLRSAASDEMNISEVASTVAAVALPEVAVAPAKSTLNVPVTTTEIDAKNKLVGFQGDLTFDERMVTFGSEPVSNAGLTGGSWNVSGNVLPGPGPIRTLRISAYSNDFTPLSGSGTLFNLNATRVSETARGTQLIWAVPPDNFIFIDADLNTQKPGYAVPGSVTTQSQL
jgi:hypothetical protein